MTTEPIHQKESRTHPREREREVGDLKLTVWQEEHQWWWDRFHQNRAKLPCLSMLDESHNQTANTKSHAQIYQSRPEFSPTDKYALSPSHCQFFDKKMPQEHVVVAAIKKPQLTATNKLQKNKSSKEFGNNNNDNSWLQTKKAEGLCLHLVFYCFLQNHLHMMRTKTTTKTRRSPLKQRFGSLPGQSFLCMSCRHMSGRPRCRLLREWHRVCLLPPSASSNPSASTATSCVCVCVCLSLSLSLSLSLFPSPTHKRKELRFLKKVEIFVTTVSMF